MAQQTVRRRRDRAGSAACQREALSDRYRSRLFLNLVTKLRAQPGIAGGPFSAELAAGFSSLPHAPAAVRLRRWDEGAKIPGKPTPGLEHFRPYLEPTLLAR
jgi:predicted HD phosphohydrolase